MAHDDVGLSRFLVFAKVVHRHDGGVFERSNDLRLAVEARAKRGVAEEFARQDFDCHVAFEARVKGKIHHRHPAPSELRFYFVAANFSRCHRAPLSFRRSIPLSAFRLTPPME